MKTKTHNSALIIHAVSQVFRNPLYIVLATIIAGSVLALAIWLPNLHLITGTFQSTTMSTSEKFNIAASLLGALQTNFTPLSRVVTITISILFGVNIALMTFYFKTRLTIEKEAGLGLGGMLLGLLGVGCASCGSVILVSLIGFGSAATVLGVLPLRGQEFGLVAIILLIFAITVTARKISTPLSC